MRYILLFIVALFFISCSTKLEKLNSNLSDIGATLGDDAYIRVFKKEKILELWVKSDGKFKLFKSYHVQKLSGYLGPKLKEGDRQVPEGVYKVYKSSLNPHSKYHLAMNIGYPNKYDKLHNRTGSAIMIHGGHWSSGCIAMGDDNIEEIYAIVKNALNKNQKFIYVAIYPFRLDNKKLDKYKNFREYKFWKDLHDSYIIFNQLKIPPKPRIKDKRYIFDTI